MINVTYYLKSFTKSQALVRLHINPRLFQLLIILYQYTMHFIIKGLNPIVSPNQSRPTEWIGLAKFHWFNGFTLVGTYNLTKPHVCETMQLSSVHSSHIFYQLKC